MEGISKSICNPPGMAELCLPEARSQYSADWGDYVSFAAHMRKRADDAGVDLLLVDTGDRVEGNGLYDASSPKGKYTYDIYREQHIDIICTGNHELYQAPTAELEHERTVPNFKDTYIASNLDYIDPKTGKQEPMAQRYRKFRTKNQKLNVVAFGFLFDFTGNANNTVVQPVAATVQEKWFQKAIQERVDVFVVIGHIGVRMQEFRSIVAAIREVNPHTPIAVLGGHAHVRDATTYDDNSFALASGRYFETIGWLSVDGVGGKADDAPATFRRRYIDNNLLGLQYHSGVDEAAFATDHGRNVSAMITQARHKMGLDKAYGCAPQDYWMSRAPFESEDSIYTWLRKEVLPDMVVKEDRKDKARLAILNTGTIRFDIFKGAFTLDTTFIVCPFLSGFRYIPDVPFGMAKKVIKLLNDAGQIFEQGGLDSRFLAIPEQWDGRLAMAASKSRTPPRSESQKPIVSNDEKPELIGGYTTQDDIGADGDDAVHAPIDFYAAPNCIQAEIEFPEKGDPETVDMVFLDFIQPWILLALKYIRADYTERDVGVYLEPSFTELMAKWIHENWKGDC